jgi:hypothetical protein
MTSRQGLVLSLAFLPIASLFTFLGISRASASQRLFLSMPDANLINSYDVLGKDPFTSFSATEPLGIAVDSRGLVYATSLSHPGSIYRYTATGQLQKILRVPDDSFTFDLSTALSFDSQGRLYVGLSYRPGSVFRFFTDGTPEGLYAVLTNQALISDLKLTSDGQLLSTDNHILSNKSNPGFHDISISIVSGQIADFDLDSQGNIYLVAGRELKKYDPLGNYIATFSTLPGISTGYNPAYTAISVDKNDLLYVAATTAGGSAYVDWFTASGSYLGHLFQGFPQQIYDMEIVTSVPEPSALALIASSLFGFGFSRRQIA